MMNNEQQTGVPNKGMVANAMAMWSRKDGTGTPSGESLPGVSVRDLSSAEQLALVDAKKRKNADCETVGTAGSASHSDTGAGGINKLDFMSVLKEQQDSSTIATKQLLSNALSAFTEK